MIGLGRRWALVGLIALAFALRVIGLDFQSLWRDEVDAIRFASRPVGDLLQTFAVPGQNGPLYYLGLRPWLDLAGRSEFALRFFSVAFGVLATPLVYRLARRLFPPLASSPQAGGIEGEMVSPPQAGKTEKGMALLAALLMATSPYLVWYGQEGKMYTLVLFLVVLSMERYLAALEQGGWHRWLAHLLAASAAFYVHLIAALIVPAQALIFFLVRKRYQHAGWGPWLASMAALTVPYLPLLIWQLPLLLKPADTGYRFLPLPQMLYSLLVSYGLGVAQGATWWNLASLVGLLLASGLLLVGRELRLAVGVLLCWLLAPVLGFYLITLVRPMYTARYLIFVLPAYLLLLAAGVAALRRRSRLLAGALLALLLAVFGWGLWLQARVPLKADFRAAARYLTDRLGADDLILFQIPYGRHSFEYYFERRARRQPLPRPVVGDYRVFLPWVVGGGQGLYRWAEGLYTNAGMSPAKVDRRMVEITRGSPVVWLVATETPLWDERNLVQAWLDEHASLTAQARFVRVTVYRYDLP